MQSSIKSKIEELLGQQIKAEFIEVTDESWQHGGGPEAQSHFKIIVVSTQFEGQKLLARHRLVQSILADIVSRVRAISLHTLTPTEWQKAEENDVSFRSPGCHNKK
jgi:BolA protein